MNGSSILSAGIFAMTILLGIGCAQGPWQSVSFGTRAPAQLEARGPGAVFASIDEAAIDALVYAYLQAVATRGTERMRGGTIHQTNAGYRYDGFHTAGPLDPGRISFSLKARDVARFLIYPRVGNHEANRANETISRADRRIVDVVDPLHRPVYVLHPSLVIRAYRGNRQPSRPLADLRCPSWRPIFSARALTHPALIEGSGPSIRRLPSSCSCRESNIGAEDGRLGPRANAA
jgi:hypothetical protein